MPNSVRYAGRRMMHRALQYFLVNGRSQPEVNSFMYLKVLRIIDGIVATEWEPSILELKKGVHDVRESQYSSRLEKHEGNQPPGQGETKLQTRYAKVRRATRPRSQRKVGHPPFKEHQPKDLKMGFMEIGKKNQADGTLPHKTLACAKDLEDKDQLKGGSSVMTPDLEDKVHLKGDGTVMTSHTKNIRGDFTKVFLALETIRAEVSEEALVERTIETSEDSSQDLAETFIEALEYPCRDLSEDPRGIPEGDLVESPCETFGIKTIRGEKPAHPRAAQPSPRVLEEAARNNTSEGDEPRRGKVPAACLQCRDIHPKTPAQPRTKTTPDARNRVEIPHFLDQAAYEDSTRFVAPSKCLELSAWTSRVHEPCALNARKTTPKEEQDISARSNEPCGEGGFKWEHEPRALMAQFEWRSRSFLDLDLSPSSPI